MAQDKTKITSYFQQVWLRANFMHTLSISLATEYQEFCDKNGIPVQSDGYMLLREMFSPVSKEVMQADEQLIQ